MPESPRNFQDSNTNQPLYSIFFTDVFHGWAVGDFGLIIGKSIAPSIQSVSIEDGWNILSVPLLAPDMTAFRVPLFPTAISDFYRYSVNTGYTQADILENGIGYWAKFSGSQNIIITGTHLSSNETPVYQGWNLIGPFALEMPVNEITTVPPNIIIYPIYKSTEQYNTADTLKPGKGYWVKTSAGME